MLPGTVAVNPQSSTDARSNAQSGFGGGLTFAFGGNPNLALLQAGAGPGGINWLVIGGVAVAIAVVVLWTRKR